MLLGYCIIISTCCKYKSCLHACIHVLEVSQCKTCVHLWGLSDRWYVDSALPSQDELIPTKSNALLWPPQSVTIIYKDWRLKSSNCLTPQGHQGAKKTIFTACHSGKLKLAFTSPDVISTSPKNFLTSRIYFKVLLLFEFLKKTSLASWAS